MSQVDVFFEQTINVNVVVAGMGSTSMIKLVQNDTGPKIQFTLKDCAGNPITDNVSGVFFYLKKYCCNDCTNEGHEAASGVNTSQGIWEYCLSGGDVSAAGTYFGDVEILYDNGRRETGYEAVRIYVRPSNKC